MKTVNTKELLNALERAMPGLADKKDFVQAYMTFSFDGEQIVTFNESVAVRVPFESGLKCSILAKEFHSIIKKLDFSEIIMGLDSNQVLIQAPGLKAKINVSTKDITKQVFDATETKQALDWKPLTSNFNEAIDLCALSVNKSGILPWMSSITIDGANVISTDSYRISTYALDIPIEGKYHIPLAAIEGAIGEKFSQYAATKQWFHMMAEDGLIYSAKLVVVDDMPDMLKFFVTNGDSFVFPEGAEKIIDLVSVVSESPKTEKRAVMISINNNSLKFKCQRQDLGWMEQELTIDYPGNPVSFFINPDFAAKILSKTRKAMIGKKYTIFYTENFKHLVATITEGTND